MSQVVTPANVVELLLTDGIIVQSYVYSYKSRKYWKIVKPIDVELSDGTRINIPEGFTYDMATVPKWLWSIVRPFNDGLFGTMVHDYLYIHQEAHSLNRLQADREMLFWCSITNRNRFDNQLRYVFIRAFGWLWWRKIL